MKIRILYVHHDSIITGSIISLSNLIAKLDRDKFEPILLLGAEGPAMKIFEELKVKIYIVKFNGLMLQPPPSVFNYDYYYNWKSLFNFDKRGLVDIFNLIRPDIVHLNDISVLIPGRIAHKMGYKTVWHIRCSMNGFKSIFQYWIAKWIIKVNSDHIISISEDELTDFASFKNTSVIYNSIDIVSAQNILKNGSTFRKEFEIKDNEIAVGMIGNLNKQKGAWNFINAAGLVSRINESYNYKFFIIAPIPNVIIKTGFRKLISFFNIIQPFEKAKQLVKKNRIENNTIFTGRRNDILNVMAGLDIVCACYNMKAIGRPGFEAASVGKPVIVNKGISGKSKIVLNGITGLTVKSESPSKLSEAIINLTNDPSLRQNLGISALEYSRNNFDSMKNANKIMKIYFKLIKNK